jgi:hypothetical protein
VKVLVVDQIAAHDDQVHASAMLLDEAAHLASGLVEYLDRKHLLAPGLEQRRGRTQREAS